jgi:hypothetical protein
MLRTFRDLTPRSPSSSMALNHYHSPLIPLSGVGTCFFLPLFHHSFIEELDGPVVSALRRAIAELEQHWSVNGWATKNLLSRAPPCFGRYVKPLVSVAFAVVSTHQPAMGPRGGLRPVLLMCYHTEGLCPSSGDINRLMMIMIIFSLVISMFTPYIHMSSFTQSIHLFLGCWLLVCPSMALDMSRNT